MIRFALWAAVSSKRQAAADKVSIDDQLQAGRDLARARGWTETAGPFVARGVSRSRWIDLATAARAIPALEALIQSARRHEFDLLICWDHTRFRSLLKPLSLLLEDNLIQLYSLAAPIEPVEPADYDPRENDTAEILLDANAMASTLESKHKQRRWRIGITGRVNSGLHFARVPFGYRKPPGHERDPLAVLEFDPPKSQAILELVNQFLAGRSLSQLVDFMATNGFPAPEKDRWNHTTIRTILRNPFYSGHVFIGRSRTRRDRYAGRTIRLPADPARLVQVRGKHPPLWGDLTQARIDAEFKRRGHAFTGRRTYAVSQLLHCSICGGMLWVKRDAMGPGRHHWRCRTAILSSEHGHAHIPNDRIVASLGLELQDALRHLDRLPASQAPDSHPDLKAERQDLLARRQRWQDAFESGQLPPEKFADRIQEIDDRLVAIQADLQAVGQARTLQQYRRRSLEALARAADGLPDYICRGDPQEVNATLREILAGVTVFPDHTIRLEWNR